MAHSNGVDNHAAIELYLHINNDQGLYTRCVESAAKNLDKKMRKGIYDHSKARKLWYHVAVEAAKHYHKDNGDSGKWYDMFDVETRRQTAAMLEENYFSETILAG